MEIQMILGFTKLSWPQGIQRFPTGFKAVQLCRCTWYEGVMECYACSNFKANVEIVI